MERLISAMDGSALRLEIMWVLSDNLCYILVPFECKKITFACALWVAALLCICNREMSTKDRIINAG